MEGIWNSREFSDNVAHLLWWAGCLRQSLFKFGLFLACGKAAPNQEVQSSIEIMMMEEIFDAYAAVPQFSFLSITARAVSQQRRS
jgi:hypothetical protein